MAGSFFIYFLWVSFAINDEDVDDYDDIKTYKDLLVGK